MLKLFKAALQTKGKDHDEAEHYPGAERKQRIHPANSGSIQ